MDGPRGEAGDGEGLGHLVRDYHEDGHEETDSGSPAADRAARSRSPGDAGPVRAGRRQRLESPPLLQSMHKRAYGRASSRALGIRRPQFSQIP